MKSMILFGLILTGVLICTTGKGFDIRLVKIIDRTLTKIFSKSGDSSMHHTRSSISSPLFRCLALAMHFYSNRFWVLNAFFSLNIWARLFKTNDVVSKRDVKISNVDISNMPIFFMKKMWEAFALQRFYYFFFQKKKSLYLVIKSKNLNGLIF